MVISLQFFGEQYYSPTNTARILLASYGDNSLAPRQVQ